MKIAERVRTLPPYLFAAIERQIAERKAAGIDVISLGIGDPDLPTPPHVIAALAEGAADPATHQYPSNQGEVGFREAVAGFYATRFGVTLDPADQIVPLLGAKEGIAHICQVLLDPGDLALAADPGYPVYVTGPMLADGAAVHVPLMPELGFQPDLEAIPADTLAKATMIFVSYPNNPTGAVIEDDFFARLVDFARANDIVVVHDNAYADITYDDYVAPSFLATPGASDVGVEMFSLSKSYNMTGWRAGAIVGNREVVDAYWRLKTNLDSGMFGAVQRAAAAALSGSQECVHDMCRIYQRRRDLLVNALRTVGMHVDPPKGTIYLWVPVPEGYTSASFTQQVLEQADVVVTPGAAYGPSGEGYVRLSLTLPDERLQEAVGRIEERVRLSPAARTQKGRTVGTEKVVDTGATEVRPRTVVFAVVPGGHGAPGADEQLAEIKELLRSADMDWVADVIQHRDSPNPRTYLGKGKMADLKESITDNAATVAVCEDDLTPAQVASVLDAVDADVLDRTELILTVFSKHAHSLEGTMQVHLAQLEYELTRMRGKGLVMSRLGAGVDMRGPGETKMEVDRRVVRKRIQTLRNRIEQMARTRRTQRAKRVSTGVPLIALAGYTNSGKSTLLNALTDAEVSVRDRLFETLDPTSRTYRFHDRDYVVTDTVGFIRKLPHQLVDAFASTLEETTLADVVLVVADASLDPSEIGVREQTVADVLDMIGSTAPRIVVFNKIDRLDDGKLNRLRALYPEAEFIAAAEGLGLDALQARLGRFFDRALRPVRLLFPYKEAGEMHRLRGIASDVREEHTPEGVIFEARLPVAEAGRYARYRLEPEIPDDFGALDDDMPEDEAPQDDEAGDDA